MATIKNIIDLMSAKEVSVNAEVAFRIKGVDVTADSTVKIDIIWDSRLQQTRTVLIVDIPDCHIEKLVQERVLKIFKKLADEACEKAKVES